MGNLHKWFKGSKSKDGKSGWVNVVTGGTCASDEPGEGTPKCVSSSKRASMTPSERKSAARRKKAADPGQQQKSGAAKPTYVSTDKPKKMKKEQFSNWRDDYVATEHEFIDLIKPEPMEGIGEEYKKLPKRKMGMKAGKKIISAVGHAGKAGAEEEGTIEDQIRRQKADKKGRQAQKIHDIAATHSPAKSKLKNIRNNLKGMTKKEGYDSETLDEAVPAVIAAVGKGAVKMATNMAKAKAKDMAVDKLKSMASKKQEVTEARKEGESIKDYAARMTKKYSGGKPKTYDPMKDKNFDHDKAERTRGSMQEEDKKGEGSGKKDACYKKVKASAKVWPSAYASGRLVQCRKKGAANYGNSNEEYIAEISDRKVNKMLKGRERILDKAMDDNHNANKSKAQWTRDVSDKMTKADRAQEAARRRKKRLAKEELSAEGYKGKHGQSDKEYMDSRSDAGKQISGDSKQSGAAYSHRSFRGQGEPAKPGERQKAQGRMTQADRDELAIRKAALKKKEEEKKEEFVSIAASQYFINEGLNEEGVSELIELLGPVEFGELVYEIAEGVEEELLTEARAGGVKIEPKNKSGKRVADLTKGARTRAINDLRKKKEAARAGEGSGGKGSMKDALKSQSKAAKKAEPKKTKKAEPKKEASKPAVEKAKAKQPKKRGFLDAVARQVNKGMDRHKKAMELARETGKVAKKAAKVGGAAAKGAVQGVKDTAKVTKSVADKLKEEYVNELKCWKGYKRKKGATPGAPGSCVKAGYSDWRGDLNLMEGVSAWQRKFIPEETKRELQIRASKGDKAAMAKLKELRAAGKIGKEYGFEPGAKRDLPEGVAAWQRKEGKNKEGGLNEKGRKSYERENPGSDLKAPQPEGGSRKKSFCARMSGMKKKLTSKKTANDPDSRINKSLRKWKC